MIDKLKKVIPIILICIGGIFLLVFIVVMVEKGFNTSNTIEEILLGKTPQNFFSISILVGIVGLIMCFLGAMKLKEG